MTTMTVEVTLSPEQASQLDEVARTRHLPVAEAIQLAVAEWLEKQYDLMQTWDEQIEDDLESGRLDTLLAEVDAEYEAGLARPL